jgi:hypothetical protein
MAVLYGFNEMTQTTGRRRPRSCPGAFHLQYVGVNSPMNVCGIYDFMTHGTLDLEPVPMTNFAINHLQILCVVMYCSTVGRNNELSFNFEKERLIMIIGHKINSDIKQGKTM